MSDYKGDLSKLLKTLRKKIGLSQEELAQRLGVSFTSVNRWENEQTKPSKLARRQIEKLCKEFDCQTSAFGKEK
jgi:putative transcriptional regulator